MTQATVLTDLERADRALDRIIGAIEGQLAHRDREDVLRARVRDVIGELDGLIRDAAMGAGGAR